MKVGRSDDGDRYPIKHFIYMILFNPYSNVIGEILFSQIYRS